MFVVVIIIKDAKQSSNSWRIQPTKFLSPSLPLATYVYMHRLLYIRPGDGMDEEDDDDDDDDGDQATTV